MNRGILGAESVSPLITCHHSRVPSVFVFCPSLYFDGRSCPWAVRLLWCHLRAMMYDLRIFLAKTYSSIILVDNWFLCTYYSTKVLALSCIFNSMNRRIIITRIIDCNLIALFLLFLLAFFKFLREKSDESSAALLGGLHLLNLCIFTHSELSWIICYMRVVWVLWGWDRFIYFGHEVICFWCFSCWLSIRSCMLLKSISLPCRIWLSLFRLLSHIKNLFVMVIVFILSSRSSSRTLKFILIWWIKMPFAMRVTIKLKLNLRHLFLLQHRLILIYIDKFLLNQVCFTQLVYAWPWILFTTRILEYQWINFLSMDYLGWKVIGHFKFGFPIYWVINTIIMHLFFSHYWVIMRIFLSWVHHLEFLLL